jgi:hypothetical protein
MGPGTATVISPVIGHQPPTLITVISELWAAPHIGLLGAIATDATFPAL